MLGGAGILGMLPGRALVAGAMVMVLGVRVVSGVPLRMFWVLSVLTYRKVPETLIVAPPQYLDEKVKVEVLCAVDLNRQALALCPPGHSE